jgi:hypothetical protein
MKLLDARVNGMPRQVTTKYGDKSGYDNDSCKTVSRQA